MGSSERTAPARRGPRLAFGAANVIAAVLLYVGVFHGLPARWLVVDLPAGALALTTATSGVGLLSNRRWAPSAARVTSALLLVLGLAAVAVLVGTGAWLRGVYGAVGRGGALIFAFVAALVLPYAVVLPALELAWLGAPRARRPEAPPEAPPR